MEWLCRFESPFLHQWVCTVWFNAQQWSRLAHQIQISAADIIQTVAFHVTYIEAECMPTASQEQSTSITTRKANSIIRRLEFNLFFLVNTFHCEDRCVYEWAMTSDKADFTEERTWHRWFQRKVKTGTWRVEFVLLRELIRVYKHYCFL
jgi:hypothetical protein